jgi:hypothetical protein
MRYAVSCRIKVSAKDQKDFVPKYINCETFNSLSDCLFFLSKEYEKAKENYNCKIEKVFEWSIFDFDREECFSDSSKVVKNFGFLDLVLEYSEFEEGSKYLHIKPSKKQRS